MKSLTDQEVSHIAKLANLELGTKELDLFSHQLSEILLYIERLNKVETKEITPLSSITDSKNVFRPDEVKPSLTQGKDFLKLRRYSHER